MDGGGRCSKKLINDWMQLVSWQHYFGFSCSSFSHFHVFKKKSVFKGLPIIFWSPSSSLNYFCTTFTLIKLRIKCDSFLFMENCWRKSIRTRTGHKAVLTPPRLTSPLPPLEKWLVSWYSMVRPRFLALLKWEWLLLLCLLSSAAAH